MHTDTNQRVLAVFAHPDDIEFMAAGTLLLLHASGWDVHYLTLSGGDCGSMTTGPSETRKIREAEARHAADLLHATFHESFLDDLLIFYDETAIRRLTAIIRSVRPQIILTHALSDYMEDHMTTARLTVTAAFARGMPNFASQPPHEPSNADTAIYHAMPHGLKDGMRRPAKPQLFIDTTAVQERKRTILAAHMSQKAWLDTTQGMDSYLDAADHMARHVGHLSGCFSFAEGWNQHLHLGLSAVDHDPLTESLSSTLVHTSPHTD